MLPTFATRARRLPTDSSKPFLDHLGELRFRLVVCAAAFVSCSLAAYFFTEPLVAYLSRNTGGFVFTHMTEAFMVKVKLALLGGALVAAPVWLYELWRFIESALEPSARRQVAWALPMSYVLFAMGLACAWIVVLPAATRFLLSYSTDFVKPLLSIDSYVGFAAWLTLAFGVLFQLPLAVFFLVGANLVDIETLAHYRRHVLVGLVIVAAMVTPGPDIVSQLSVFVPTYILYEISYWAARLVYRSK